jgi:cell division septum initiation protein DivIVA
MATGEYGFGLPTEGDEAGLPESEFDTVMLGFAPDQVAGYLERVATSVLSLQSRLRDTTSELLETRRERDSARAELQAALAVRDPHETVSDRVTELVRIFDHQVSALLRDAEVEAERVHSEVRTEADHVLADARDEADRVVAEAEAEADRARADARMLQRESRIRAGRLIIAARQESDRTQSDLATLRGTMLDSFRDIRERTLTALSEVEAVIENGATSDRLVVVDDVAEFAPDLPEASTPDR